MKKLLLLTLILFFIKVTINAQSCANYSVTRNTGITYTSFATTANPIPFWRNQLNNQNDDNRSDAIPIGFDFWYLGQRYTTVNVSINGFIDFSSTIYDGNAGLPVNSAAGVAACGTAFSYREQGQVLYNVPCGSGVAPNSYDGTYWAVAAMYCDLWTGSGGANAVGNSIKYITTGAAPNRVLTVEYIGMDDYANPVFNYSFQIKLYESTGIIDIVYGNMLPAVGVPTPYSCGINGRIFTNPPTADEMLVQQANNSGTFNNTNPGLRTAMPESNSKLTFTPVVPANPILPVTFSAVGNTTMTLNWTDWATNELAYVVYSSTDNVNFSFAAQLPANATSYTANNLYGSVYYWKVYAVTEGCLSTPALGTQATLPAGTFISIKTGVWSDPTTWSALAVPTNGDNVIINNTHTVTIDGNYGCTNLQVGNGISGTLLLGNDATNRSFTLIGDLTVTNVGTFTSNPAFTATHTITSTGNITNNGTINFRSTATSLTNILFTKAANQTISGTGTTHQYNTIAINMGSSINNTLEVTATNFAAPTDFLTMINGTFKFSVPTNAITLNIFSTAITIPNTCGIWMNSPNSTMIALSSLTFKGDLTLSNGKFKIGNVANESLISNGAKLTITNGDMEVAGRLTRPSYVAITRFNMSGGTLTLNTIGSNDATPATGTVAAYPFMIDAPGSSFNMTGGKIIIRNAGTGSGLTKAGYCNLNCNPYVFSGGSLQIGDASTIASQQMQINTDNSIANLVVDNSSANIAANMPKALQATNLIVTKDVWIKGSCSLLSQSKNLTIGGNFTNDGIYSAGTNTFTFNGSAAQQMLGATATLTLNNLTINNTLGDVTIATTAQLVNIGATLSFMSGKLILGTNRIAITGALPITGFNASRYIVTNGTNLTGLSAGFVRFLNLGTTVKDIPIGVSTSEYTPVLNFSNAGTVDNFNFRVFPNVYQNGTSGTIKTLCVNRTWEITESIAGGSNVNMTLQWNGTNELAGFNNTDCGISHYGPTWDVSGNISAATGGGPYLQYRNNITVFSPFAIASRSFPLPINLLKFNGEEKTNSNYLYWETATETNNNYFNLEHSLDGLGFENIAKINGAGTSETSISYNFDHENPQNVINYYRLKQTDYDGKYSYSSIIAIDNTTNEKSNQISVYPNPTKNILNISIDAQNKCDINIELINSLGQIIQTKTIAIDKGSNTKQIDIKEVSAGAYQLKITINGVVTYKKIIVE